MSIRKIAIGLMALVLFKISYAAGLDAKKLLRAVNEEKSSFGVSVKLKVKQTFKEEQNGKEAKTHNTVIMVRRFI